MTEFEALAKREHTFEELKLLCTAKEAVIRLYEQLTCKCDERLLVLRELIKRECVPYSFWKGQIEPLAAALSQKRYPDGSGRTFGTFRI